MLRELLDKNITISLKSLEDIKLAISYLNKNIQEASQHAIPTITFTVYKQEFPRHIMQ